MLDFDYVLFNFSWQVLDNFCSCMENVSQELDLGSFLFSDIDCFQLRDREYLVDYRSEKIEYYQFEFL